ncbi:immunity protein YezG family protein [Vibrio metschnikovii]|uniref:immunity protein YezG family protein n=1 Tax=Vibrio metschnikovii TaxID=28172 RepID=UPI0027DFB856|nr:immunity protein YezG family protein [Vibrio metschnikovii]
MRSVDDIYMSLAQGIKVSIKDSWSMAWINASVLEDTGGIDGEYISSGSDDVKFFSVEDQAFDDFEELHEIMAGDGNVKWNRAKFTLYPTGKFSIDFEWDQALADEVEANS